MISLVNSKLPLCHQFILPSLNCTNTKDSRLSTSGYTSKLSNPQLTISPVSLFKQYASSPSPSMTIYFFSKPFFLKWSASFTNREYPLRPHAASSTPYPIRTPYFCINLFTSSLNEMLNCFSNSDTLSSVHLTISFFMESAIYYKIFHRKMLGIKIFYTSIYQLIFFIIKLKFFIIQKIVIYPESR